MPALGLDGDDPVTGRVRRRRRRWPVAAAAALVLAGGAGGGLWYVASRDDAGAAGSAGGPTVSLERQAVKDYDPASDGGDGHENPNDVKNVYDGIPSNAWYTESYFTPAFGGYKPGVGLIVRLKEPARATQLEVVSPTPGATFQVLGPDEGSGRPVYASGTFTAGQQHVPLRVEQPTAVYVLWITKLVPRSDDPGRYWAGVGEVSLRGPANP
jgi:hypothetical protein